MKDTKILRQLQEYGDDSATDVVWLLHLADKIKEHASEFYVSEEDIYDSDVASRFLNIVVPIVFNTIDNLTDGNERILEHIFDAHTIDWFKQELARRESDIAFENDLGELDDHPF